MAEKDKKERGNVSLEIFNEKPVYSLIKVNDTTIAFGLESGTIKLWDIAQNKEVSTLNGHSDCVSFLLKFSDQYIISASDDDTIRVWDITNPAACSGETLITDNIKSGTSLLKISDTEIIYLGKASAENTNAPHSYYHQLKILNLADMAKPTVRAFGPTWSLFDAAPSVIASPSHIYIYSSNNLKILHRKTLEECSHQKLDSSSMARNSYMTQISSLVFITSDAQNVRIWSLEKPEKPKVLALLPIDDCKHITRLSNTSFACIRLQNICVFNLNKEAHTAYNQLNLQNYSRLHVLCARLRRGGTLDDNVNKQLYDKMPKILQERINDRFLPLQT
jgi:WD40 repeat protein